jgi:hypothetical protein
MSLQIRTSKAKGDPGVFGFLGKVVKTGLGVATSFIPGPAGAIARGLQSKLFGGGQRALPSPQTLQRLRMPLTMNGGGTTYDFPDFSAKPRNGVITMPTGEVGFDTTPAVACPPGYRPNKAGYYRRIKSPGNPEGSVFYIAPKSRCVKIRKRNAANPRAADRAISRIESAKRFAKRMSRVTVRKKCDCS